MFALRAFTDNTTTEQSIRFVMESHNGTEQAFSVDKTGEIKLERNLDYETQMTHQFIVWVTDGLTVRFYLLARFCVELTGDLSN